MIGSKMSKSHKYLLVATISMWGLLPPAGQAMTLGDVVAYAYETNPGLQAQRAEVRATDETYVQARAGYGLTVSLAAGATAYNIERNHSKADADTNNNSISIVQPLYTGGRVRARVSEAEAQVLSSREQLRRVEMDLLQRVVAAYLAVRRDEQLLKIAQDTVEVLNRGLSDTKAKYDVHAVTITDLAQSRARLSQAKTQLFGTQEQLADSRAQFFAVVGQNPLDLQPPPVLEALPANVEQAFDAAEANNPQILSAQYVEKGSRARVARAKAGLAPTINARLEFQHAPYLPYQHRSYDNTRVASVVVNQPLFAAGQIQSAIRQSIEENNRDRLTVDDTRLQVIQNVSFSWERLVSLRQQLITLQEEMKADELAFLGVRAEERFALRSNIEILNAAAELNAAQQNYTRAAAAEYVARVQLLAQIGMLAPGLLSKGGSSYDPAENFRKVKNIGITPLEIPVRLLDAMGSQPIARPRPASLAESQPIGSAPQPTPTAPKAATSVLEIIKLDPKATTLPSS